MADKNKAKTSDNKWAVMGGIALNVEYTRKYGFDATGAAKVNAKLVAVPPPSLFQEAVQADIAGRAKRAEGPVLPEPGPVGPVLPEPVPKPGFLAINLIDEVGQAVANTRYVVTLDDGSTRAGVLDAQGQARLDGLAPGTYNVSFPELDAADWGLA